MEIWQQTAQKIAKRIQRREISAEEATKSALGRMADVNGSINAVVDNFDEEALKEAQLIDSKISAGETVGSLAGVPLTVKVNVDQIGRATTNGLRLQKNLFASKDNPVVANLRKAGAIIIGRTNTPAFSLRWFTRNSLHGHTKNPLNPKITPGGSSGGAAAAVAAGIGTIGHGTDIAGSIRYPAYACGVHGLRPSLGRVPAYNFSRSDRFIGAQLTAVSGPIARSIGDLRLALDAMSQPDIRDPWYVPMPLNGNAAPKRIAISISPDGLDVDPIIKTELLRVASKIKAAGWQVEEVELPPLRQAMENQLFLWMAEMKHGVGSALSSEQDPDALQVYDSLLNYIRKSSLNDVMDVLQTRSALTREWRVFLETYPVVLCPVSGQLPFEDLLDLRSQTEFNQMIDAQMLQIGLPFMGLPCLSVTTGKVKTGPVGVQLISSHFREDLLLDIGEIIGERIEPVSPKF
jgi:amidase